MTQCHHEINCVLEQAIFSEKIYDDISSMSSEAILAEYDFLKSSTAQEKDPRKGVSMGLSLRNQARLAEIEKCILSALNKF